MPQMSPLPWVSLLMVVLGLTMMYMILVYFSVSKSLNSKNIKVNKLSYSWKW
uniref:ATP synthase F0 subunit 8 n=1 Tax=Trachelipus rathkii TaxID=1720764 RepID=A0A0G2T5W5_9CRUS|nr:ATP synthase F0 subunit 8 [Trachelipus rathkii]